MKSIQDRARAYIARIHSISGSGGHTAALKAALALVKGYDLPEDEALAILREWNETHASPPWSESDLVHKIRDAAKSDKPAGYLLTKDNGHQFPKAPPSPWGGPAKTALKRLVIPALTKGTDMQLRDVATLRGISPHSVWLASNAGYLRFTLYGKHQWCYVMTEEELVQLRRMDGQPFTKVDGTAFKSWNLPGTRGTWLGYSTLERYPAAPVVIAEGLVAWMEAAEAIDRAECLKWIPFASLSATVKLGERELALLKGRQVIIARDRGAEGAKGAIHWQTSLHEIGVIAPIWTPPLPAKDLGEALQIPSFNPTSIFNSPRP